MSEAKMKKARRGRAVFRFEVDVTDPLLRAVEGEIGPLTERSQLEAFLEHGFDTDVIHPLVKTGEDILRTEEQRKAREQLEDEERRVEKMRRDLEEREAKLAALRGE